ncbi:MAG: aminopeptidase [Moorella sp. (in: firmicutes)]
MELQRAYQTLARDCLAIKKDETVLIIVDDESKELGETLEKAVRQYAGEAILLKMKTRSRHGEEPPLLVAEAMGLAEVVIAPTTRSITHTEARRKACQRGARIASMPGIDLNMLTRTLNADYNAIQELTHRLSNILTQGKTVEVSSALGTKITFAITGRQAIADTGMIKNPGDFGNLPAGEAYIAPLEGTAEGVIVFDGMIAGVGRLEDPIKARIEGGKLVNAEGGAAARALTEMLAKVGNEQAYNLAEFGIGTNDKAMITGKILEDEKVIGTIHFAFGDNASMGGMVKVPIHVDGVVTKPTVKIDGNLIMIEGQLVIEQ